MEISKLSRCIWEGTESCHWDEGREWGLRQEAWTRMQCPEELREEKPAGALEPTLRGDNEWWDGKDGVNTQVWLGWVVSCGSPSPLLRLGDRKSIYPKTPRQALMNGGTVDGTGVRR